MIPLESFEHVNLLTNDGRPVVKLKFEDLIAAAGEYIQETSQHLVIICPKCLSEKLSIGNEWYHKRKLYLDSAEDPIQQGYCQRCNTIFFDLNHNLVVDLPRGRRVDRKFKLVSLPNEPLDALDRHNLTYFRSMDLDVELLNERLRQRGSAYVSSLIKPLGIRGAGDYIAFPFILGGKFIYWQLRYFNPIGNKYFMPRIEDKPFYVPVNRNTGKVLFVEGVFDALASLYLFPDFTPIALLGSNLTLYHIWLLRQYFKVNYILVALDSWDLSNNIRNVAKRSFPTLSGIDIVRLPSKDPDELLRTMTQDEIDEFKLTYSNCFNNRLII